MRMTSCLSALAVSCLVALGACGGGGEADPTAPVTQQPADAERAAAVADRCGWSVGRGRGISQERVQRDFFDATDGEELGLLLETQVARPGEQFEISLMNNSEESFLYGVGTHIEDAATGDVVQIRGPLVTLAIGLDSRPGEAGPCVTVSVPSTTAPGSYRVVLSDMQSLSAPIEISGKPLPHPEWEQQLMDAARKNRR